MERIAVFPGSFDPFTFGHKSVVESALSLFDKIIIAIGVNSAKQQFFQSPEERKTNIERIFANNPKISVEVYSGLTAEFCKKNHTTAIIRGIRNAQDFAYEAPIAQTNRQLFGVETVFLATPPELSHISSSLVRELASYGTDVSRLLP